MPRLSNGLFLQVLSARPQAGVPLEITVWDGANPANMLAELQDASDIQFQHVLSDVGSGTFRIAVADPKATATNIRQGNLVKIRLSDVDIFPYFIESPLQIVAESGDSYWELKGPGALSYLSQGVVYPPGWPTPTGTDRVWTNTTFGSVLKTLIDEAQARGALTHLTYDFTAAVDSLNDPWDANLTFTVHARTTILDVIKQFASLGMDVQVTPNLVLQTFKAGTFGRDLSTSVIFRSGRHIVGSVQKVGIRSQLQNGVLVEGSGGKFIEVNDPTSIADPYTGRREGGVSFTSSSDPTTLQNAGNAQIRITEADANAISLPLNHDANPGGYTPYTDYVPGDWISLDVPGQYAMAKYQIRQLQLKQTEGGDYDTTADLNAVALDYLVRLRNALASAIGTGGGTGGSSSASLGLGAPTPVAVPLTTNTPSSSAPGDVGAVGAGTTAARDDHQHGREAWGLAGDVGTETFGATAAAGVSGKVADAGHVHAMPANPAPSPAASVTGPDAYGAAAVVGTSLAYARQDHDHGLPASVEGLPLGLTGATAATRYVGATTSGAPVSGTFAVGDFIVDRSGSMWVCTTAGSPGTWTQVAGGSIAVDHNGTLVGTRGTINFIDGTNVTLTVADNGGASRVDVTVAASGGGGSVPPPVSAAALVTAYNLFR